MKKIERLKTIPHFFHDNTIEVEELALNEQELYIEQLEEYREELIQMFKNLIKEKKYTTYCAYADNGWSHEESMRKAQNDIKKELEFLHETRR